MVEQSGNVMLRVQYVQNEKTIANNPHFAEQIRNRAYYSCNDKKNDALSYVHNGIKNFIAYAGDENKSSGIFGKDGLFSKSERADLRNQLRATESVIWHGLISFRREFSDVHCGDYKAAMAMLQKQFPKFLRKAGFDLDNITWYAGFHENTEHKHIHFSFFENKPTRYSTNGKGLKFSEGHIAPYVFEETRRNMEMYFLNLNIFPHRDKLLREFKEQMPLSKVQRLLTKLANKLPHEGRLGYTSENMEKYQWEVDEVVRKIVFGNKSTRQTYGRFLCELERHDKEILRICDGKEARYKKLSMRKKYTDSLQTRLGNIVINAARKVRQELREIEFEKKKFRRASKKYRTNILRELNISAKLTQEIQNIFSDYLDRLDSAEYKRLQEEGYRSTDESEM